MTKNKIESVSLEMGGLFVLAKAAREVVMQLAAGDAMRRLHWHSPSEAVQTAGANAVHRRAVRAAGHR